MDNFVFKSATEIVFGKGTHVLTGQYTAQYGRKILLHYGGGTIKRSGLYDEIVRSLKAEGVRFIELPGVSANPVLSLVYRGIELCREQKIDMILAVGGGSVIDSAKAIAVGAKYEGDVWDFFQGKAQPMAALPVGCVLTIMGAGSEGSKGCVITNEEGLLKRSLSLDINRPVFAIINPELQYSVSKYLLASGGVDIMAHVMERYFTNVKNVDFTDRLCEATLKTVIDNLPKALARKDNYEALSELSWASTIAQNNLLGTGRVPDMAAHNIEHELSGYYNVAHGAGLAAITASWMRKVYMQDIDRFVQFATRVWDVPDCGQASEQIALAGIQALEDFYKHIGMPTTITELGVNDFDDATVEMLADKCTNGGRSSLGNFSKLQRQDIVQIFKMAR